MALTLSCRACTLHRHGMKMALNRMTTATVTSLMPNQHINRRGVATKAEVNETVKQYKQGNFDVLPDPTALKHFRSEKPKLGSLTKDSTPAATVTNSTVPPPPPPHFHEPPVGQITLPHPIWSQEELEDVKITHNPAQGIVEHMSYYTVQVLRKSFDLFSGFYVGKKTERKWLTRFIFLETVAGVPGMVAAMTRHLRSLRTMSRDHGWIHTLLEEAENERMHLMTVIQLKNAGIPMRLAIMGAQGVFVTLFSASYLLSPRFCHKFVGYLEEEAVKTYTACINDIDEGNLQQWTVKPAPDIAIRYWNLSKDAVMRDVILNIRADEAHHRLVNHTLGALDPDDHNPYPPGA